MASTVVTANFVATDSVAVVYSGITNTSPTVIVSDPVITDGTGPRVIYVDGAPTSSALTVKASAAFTGTVTLVVSD